MGNLCVSSIKFDIESYIASLVFIFVFVFVFIFVFIFVFVFVLKVKFDACELDKVWHLKLHCFACICLCICLCIHICIKSKNWCATRVWASWGSFAKLHLKLHCFAFAHSAPSSTLGERELDQTFKSAFLQTFSWKFNLNSLLEEFLHPIPGFYFSVI